MVEGDLVDLSLPSLFQAVARERSTAVLRLQREGEHGALFFREGSLVHALAGPTAGDEAVGDLLGWSDGRFRLARDPESQPRTISPELAQLVSEGPARGERGLPGMDAMAGQSGDELVLNELLTLLSQLERDKTRLEEQTVMPGSVAALLLVAAVVNAMIAVVTARCGDAGVLPSRVLPRLAED